MDKQSIVLADYIEQQLQTGRADLGTKPATEEEIQNLVFSITRDCDEFIEQQIVAALT